PAHGREFAVGLTDLVGLVLGPEAGFVYRVVFGDSGVV
ncbi:TIGR04338 family metallohydrolase, partial [Streptomyces sp. SID10244]|nr:TIGR04338 family metallohydrolase [Streptomyces sp. SID10244]